MGGSVIMRQRTSTTDVLRIQNAERHWSLSPPNLDDGDELSRQASLIGNCVAESYLKQRDFNLSHVGVGKISNNVPLITSLMIICYSYCTPKTLKPLEEALLEPESGRPGTVRVHGVTGYSPRCEAFLEFRVAG